MVSKHVDAAVGLNVTYGLAACASIAPEPIPSSASQGLTIRMAKALNRANGRSGKVFRDRYHAHILRTPSEVANARHYLLDNYAKHHAQTRGWALPSIYVDEYGDISVEITAAPHTWLLREGWRRRR